MPNDPYLNFIIVGHDNYMSRRKSKEMSSNVLVLPCVMEKILDYERPKQRKRTRKLKRNFEQTGSVLDFTSMNTALSMLYEQMINLPFILRSY